MNSNKLIIGKYQTLARILAEIPNVPEDQLNKSLVFSAKGLGHALQDVRQPASKCMIELYKYFGGHVREHFGGLRQAQIDQIESQLAEVDANQGITPQSQAPQRKEIISTNINPKGATASKPRGNAVQKGKQTKQP